jgi:hypothetical protein
VHRTEHGLHNPHAGLTGVSAMRAAPHALPCIRNYGGVVGATAMAHSLVGSTVDRCWSTVAKIEE